MPWKSTDEMTREELVAQLEQLRDVVERLAAAIPRDSRDSWSEENADAIEERRRWIEENGMPLADGGQGLRPGKTDRDPSDCGASYVPGQD